MKKLVLLFFILITGLVMISCKDKISDHEVVFKENLIKFAEGDTKDNVTQDITLLTTSKKIKGAKIKWESSKSSVIEIDGNKGIVTRYIEDKEVTLKVHVTIDKVTKTKNFKLIVKGIETSATNTPKIEGAKDLTLKLGSEEPNWLEGISANDEVDGNVEVFVDVNTVELNKVGIYYLTYKAVNQAGNSSTVTVYVSVLEDEDEYIPKETFVESFSDVPNSGSTYKDLSFTGVNNVYWNITGARSDSENDLDGKAITFGGRTSDNSQLSATIQGGITSFSLEAKKAYTSSNPRILELYINDELIDTFTLNLDSNEIQKFEVNDININGEFTLELKQVLQSSRAQITIDNLTWTSYGTNIPSEKQNLLKDLKALNIVNHYMKEGNIDLPNNGEFGSDITWTYVDDDNPNNQYIDLNNKVVVLPEEGTVSIGLKAVLTNGEYEAVRTFNIKVGEGEPISILEVRSLSNNSVVRVKGVISEFYESDEGIHFFIQDGTGGILGFVESSYSDKIKIGNEITLTGIKETYKSQSLIKNITKIDILGTKEITSQELNKPSDLSNYVGEFVKVSGLLKQTYGAYTEDYIIINENGLFNLLIPEAIKLDVTRSIQDIFVDKPAGIEIIINAPVYRVNNAYYLLLCNPNNIEVKENINLDLIKYVLENNISFPNLPDVVEGDINLLSDSDLYFGANIIWSSSNESILSNTGDVNRINEDVTVKLSYKITYEGNEIITGFYDLTVKAKSSFGDYYASLEGKTGEALKAELHRIISSNVKNKSYDDAKYILGESDASPDNPDYCILVYSREEDEAWWHYNEGGWNREHIWPQSRLGSASDSDLHNLKPADVGINSSRGNSPFVDGSGSYGERGSGWFPGEEDKGDIARIVFYMNIRWNLSITPSNIGSLQTFIKWHYEDPVDDFERNRNEVIYKYQNNRNPFIDHPWLVEEIYGSATSFMDYELIDLLVYEMNQVNSLYDLRKRIY